MSKEISKFLRKNEAMTKTEEMIETSKRQDTMLASYVRTIMSEPIDDDDKLRLIASYIRQQEKELEQVCK